MTTARAPRPTLLVLAGVNGAGKSSIAGASLRASGLAYYNPDQATRRLRADGMDADAANAAAWAHGRQLLLDAIEHRVAHAFETTLGGNTMPALIRQACESHDVTLWFVGLDTVERHLARVAHRVRRGGHDIAPGKIRERWDGSRHNLIALMPHLYELRVYDNSAEHPRNVAGAQPRLLLHLQRGRIRAPTIKQLALTPDWAKPIVEAARQQAPGPRLVRDPGQTRRSGLL